MNQVRVRVLVKKEISIQLEVARTVQGSPGTNHLEIFGVNEELSLSVHCCSDLIVSDLEG
uniref:Uncharacterized protein n=1 Tax=Arundo donax TaxID=35708 RepID=A0A0A9DXW6_ARUDO